MSSSEKQRPHLTPDSARQSARRQEKLAAALRANLARRKAQARARDAVPLPPEPPKPRD